MANKLTTIEDDHKRGRKLFWFPVRDPNDFRPGESVVTEIVIDEFTTSDKYRPGRFFQRRWQHQRIGITMTEFQKLVRQVNEFEEKKQREEQRAADGETGDGVSGSRSDSSGRADSGRAE